MLVVIENMDPILYDSKANTSKMIGRGEKQHEFSQELSP